MMPRYDSISAITLSENSVNFALDKAEGTFDGTLSNDGKTLSAQVVRPSGCSPLSTARFGRLSRVFRISR